MPAIQPAILRQQSALLAEHFNDPPAYKREFHHLLDFYADRSRRLGQAGTPPPMISAYHVRPPILRAVLKELGPLIDADPDAGLQLCDTLWEEPYLEFRLLAAMMLGQMPTHPPERILQRLKTWILPDLEFYLIEALMQHGLQRLRAEQPQSIVRLIQEWLEQKNPFYKQLGLRALLPLIDHPDFQNMPVFYRLIQPLTIAVPTGLRPDLLDVLKALANRSPQETAFFLQQSLSMPDSKDTAWLIRQSLKHFPDDLQRSLKAAEKQTGTHSA